MTEAPETELSFKPMKYELKRKILHFFFPTRCPVCGEVIDAMGRFCPECEEKITQYTGSFNIRGAAGFTAAYVYDKNSSPAVILMKKGVCGNADYALGQALAEKLRNSALSEKCEVIIPVPLHRSSLRERGYNQAELIAEVLSHELHIPVAAECIIKMRKTAAQKKLNRIQRQSNLKGAFSAEDSSPFSGKTVLLVDDVCTTGSTLAELTALLKSSGASAVYCAACCKTPPNNVNNRVQQG